MDQKSQDLVNAYGKALTAVPVEAKPAEATMRTIGEEICSKCHLVHVPAAYAKRR